jgi:hypothetical protein
MTEDATQIVWAKILVLLGLFVSALVIGLIPLRW